MPLTSQDKCSPLTAACTCNWCFRKPQRLAIVYLMRSEQWPFHVAESMLALADSGGHFGPHLPPSQSPWRNLV
jgi:hypothetical protein